jgi:hypothetical protein
MSPRRKTVPPTQVSSRSSHTGRSELIVGKKNEKQSAKRRTALDNRFHRTGLAFTRAARPERLARETCNLQHARHGSAGPRSGAASGATPSWTARRNVDGMYMFDVYVAR